eukprot:CAMPEP_0181314260 /NCGR_PEP_ID=MMETSP1101-20121128/14715_1 /TAXON_ID=46948 /ORGANISM="Rhodomonas abbreviata, Strain Caron Lab Isolate" /LENGTH=304 /DNA_ID=CAMNT_0023421325 /DNA_START=115 /DNA_END=1029 /DNA_ORIENTATION=-
MGDPKARAGCAKSFLVVVNAAAVVLSLAAIIFGFVILYSDVTIALVSSFPQWILYVIIVFNGFVFFLSILGLIAGCGASKAAVVVFVVFSLLTLLVQIIAVVFAMLYANGIAVTDSLNDFAVDLQTQLETTLIDMAVDEPAEWLATVETFDCCGVDFEANYEWPNYAGYNATTFIDALQVDHVNPQPDGSLVSCAAGREELYEILALYPTLNATALQVAEDAPVIGSTEEPYFCKDKISKRAQEWTTYIAAVIGVLLFIQVISTTAACYLLCGATVSQGGFKQDKEGNAGDLAGFQSGGNDMAY